ncbi:alpha-amylase family protein [Raineyella fluvialis]|uniref:Trehalose synthase n=1 Tax=Raineyella fluvialis TaxID=2662261 RepID=A0A5Q2FHN5_9ACTN|nr:alpha-amylase family protein [Raineyella fluvialis]QGF23866.1 trehalose synthase [Raineyella fluvialis]
MQITETSDLWWKSAVIYCLDIETFLDANGDGSGDLGGLARRMDYLNELGITCLWLMPFYPSPDRDDGYDIVDFYGVDPRLGNHGELVEVIRTAHDRGIRVIADLVINHTSDKHPWFREARRSKDNRYRDFYVWRDTPPPDTHTQVVFPDKETSVWQFDERTEEWYLHHFYKYQPDLNTSNPDVRREILRIIGFWLQLGIDGFRVDAVPYFLSSDKTSPSESMPGDPHLVLKSIRSFLERRKGSAMMLGEVNLPYDQQLAYFGGEAGDELNQMFDFVGMQAAYLSFAREDATPLKEALLARPPIHATCAWANFLRNHDELTLDKLSESERQEVFDAFGPEENMQLYGRGLKRRLPSMLGGDPRRIRMAYSLMFSLPGTPALYYGEEIGMIEDLEAEGRMAVRTPMQWSDRPNGGFSTTEPRHLVQRLVPDGGSPEHINVARQRHEGDSLWNFIRDLIGLRRTCNELGWGEVSILDQPAPSVLAHRCDLPGAAIIAVHNLASEAVTIDLSVDALTSETMEGDPDGPKPVPFVCVDLWGPHRVELENGVLRVALPAYGYRWFRILEADDLDAP